MRNATIALLALVLSSCVAGYSAMDSDDTYARSSYRWDGGWHWHQDPYFSPFWGYPYYNPYFNYPRRDVIIVVPKQDYASPREYKAPQQRPQIQGPRRGSRQQ